MHYFLHPGLSWPMILVDALRWRFLFRSAGGETFRLNTGKKVAQSFLASILGGELDGVNGELRHARETGQRFMGKSLALVSLRRVPQVALQHWCGFVCFLCSFRRPLFAVVQGVYL